MSAVTITNRRVGSHGGLRRETGDFTGTGTGDYQIVTTLGRIVWFTVQCRSANDNDGQIYWNYSDAGTTIANGTAHIEEYLANNGEYAYEAIGYG